MFQIRASERTTLKRCPQKWYWRYVDHLVPIRDANPLWFGGAVHVALAEWYQPGLKRGPHPAETFDDALEGDRSFLVTNEEEEMEYANARTLGIDMLERYVEHYGNDDSWDVIATEQQYQVWIPHPRKKVARWLRHVGTFDGVYRDLVTEEILLMEHKTAAGIDPNHLGLDDQAGTYWAVANSKLRKSGVLKQGESIAGINYNFLRKAMRDTRPQDENGQYRNKAQKVHYVEALTGVDDWSEDELKKMKIDELDSIAAANYVVVLGEVSKSQPPAYFERWPVYRNANERRTMIARIQAEATYAERWRAGDPNFPLFKTPTRDCRWQCAFNRMCELHEQGDDGWEDFRDAMFNRADPYEDHERKSAE